MERLDPEQVFINSFEREQYALVYYLQHGNPGPVLKQIAEDRIRFLEFRKNRSEPINYYQTESKAPLLTIDKALTVGDC